jgi:hypothetical protein
MKRILAFAGVANLGPWTMLRQTSDKIDEAAELQRVRRLICATGVLATLAAFAPPAAAQVRDSNHYNQITLVDHVSTVQVPVVLFFYVDSQLVGSTYVYNGTVTTEVHDGQHHLEVRVKTADGVERIVERTDIVLDYNDYTWTIDP